MKRLLSFLLLLPLLVISQDNLEKFNAFYEKAKASNDPEQKVLYQLAAVGELKNKIILADSLSLRWAFETPKEYKKEQNLLLLHSLIASNWLGHYNQTDSISELIIPYFKENNDSLNFGRSLIEKGITNRRRMKLEESLSSLRQAIKILKTNQKWQSTFHYANYHLASTLAGLDDIEQAKKVTNKFYLLTDSLKDTKNLGYFSLMQAGLVLKSKPDYISIKEKLLKDALNIPYQSNDCILRGLTFLNLTGLTYQKKDYASALNYLDDLMENDLCQGKSLEATRQYIYKRKGNVYFKMGDYKSALKFHLLHYNIVTPKLIENSTSDLSKMDLTYLKNYPHNCLALMNCYQALNQPDSAIYWGQIGLMTSKRLADKTMEKNFLIGLSNNHQKLGQLELGIDLLKQGYAIKDSLILTEKHKDLQKVEAEFELVQNRRKKEQAELNSLKESERANKNLLSAIVIGFSALFGIILIWNKQQKKRAKTEGAKIEIEQRFLRSQLNPHFSFNALVVLQNLINLEEKQEASLYLARYARLYRSILENSRESTISLDEEIKVLSDYMELQKTRLNHKFDFELEVPENLEIDFYNIPPMMLQPIIENSIEHGFDGITLKGIIRISIQHLEDKIHISITDNGKGNSQSPQNKGKRSLSSTINEERIVLMNKEKPESEKITFETSLNNEGCSSILIIPDNL